MLSFLILTTAIFTVVNARPNGGSSDVLGWCATQIPRCDYSSLYDCMNRGGLQMCYCINHCRCENKNQPPSTAKACEGQKKPDPVPAPSPLSFFDNNVGDTTDLDVSEEESVPPEQSTDQKSPVSFDGLDQYIQTATTQPSDIESSTGDVVALATDDANQNADQYGSQDISFGNGDVTWAAW